MNDPFEYVFPAIRGTQARREYFVSMCPLRLIPKIFLFDEEELVPELRAQRTLNKARLPEIARYILKNRDDYVFSAITASIDGKVRFEPIGNGKEGKRGTVNVVSHLWLNWYCNRTFLRILHPEVNSEEGTTER